MTSIKLGGALGRKLRASQEKAAKEVKAAAEIPAIVEGTGKTFVRTIDATPAWSGLLPAMLETYEHGTPENREVMRSELTRMAAQADAYLAIVKETKEQE